jgi:hypothetical protein
LLLCEGLAVTAMHVKPQEIVGHGNDADFFHKILNITTDYVAVFRASMRQY